MKKVSELTDRELMEWHYEISNRSEKHLNFIATYFKVVAALAVIGMISFAVVTLALM